MKCIMTEIIYGVAYLCAILDFFSLIYTITIEKQLFQKGQQV